MCDSAVPDQSLQASSCVSAHLEVVSDALDVMLHSGSTVTSFIPRLRRNVCVCVLSGALICPCEELQKCCLSSSLCSVSFILTLKFAFSSGIRKFSLLLIQGNYWLQRLKLFKKCVFVNWNKTE